jgi:aspartate dehydrogenase
MNTFDEKSGFAIIGYGAITEEMIRTLEAHDALTRLRGVLVRPSRRDEALRKAAGRFRIATSAEDLLGLAPDIVLECAGHGAMRDYACDILASGRNLVISSVGVLADGDFSGRLMRAAKPPADLWIASGAIAGVDGLLAARTAGLRQVTYTSIKPPLAWIGTPAEGRVRAECSTILFEGTARDAALAYPQNVNVGATVALAGLGLDRTLVRLVSDPAASGPLGIVEAEGTFGRMRFEILAYASPQNPKTSLLTAHSMLASVLEGCRFSGLQALARG